MEIDFNLPFQQYTYNTTSWVQLGEDIDGEAASDQSGRSVSLSNDGSIVAVGAYGNDANGDNSGRVRVYMRVSTVDLFPVF